MYLSGTSNTSGSLDPCNGTLYLGHASGIISIDISRDGKRIVAVGLDAQHRQLIVIWSLGDEGVSLNRTAILTRRQIVR